MTAALREVAALPLGLGFMQTTVQKSRWKLWGEEKRDTDSSYNWCECSLSLITTLSEFDFVAIQSHPTSTIYPGARWLVRPRSAGQQFANFSVEHNLKLFTEIFPGIFIYNVQKKSFPNLDLISPNSEFIVSIAVEVYVL